MKRRIPHSIQCCVTLTLAMFLLITRESGVFSLSQTVANTQDTSIATVISWPRFRGPNGSGIADKDKPPIQFGQKHKLLWKTPLPPGHSSPIIWNDSLFLTALENNKLILIAIRRTDGKQLWKQILPAEKIERTHSFNSPAASTPTTDGQRVYVYCGSFGLLAYDFAGKEIWRKPLPLAPTRYGSASSPIVYDNKVIVQRDGNDGKSELLAADCKIGATIWQRVRPALMESWSTPVIHHHAGQDELLVAETSRLTAYSLKDGGTRWWVGGLAAPPITVPVIGDGLIFASVKSLSGAPGDRPEIPGWEQLLRFDLNGDKKITVEEIPAEAGIHLRREIAIETPGNLMSLRGLVNSADQDQDRAITRNEWEALLSGIHSISDSLIAVRPGASGDSTRTHVAWKADRGISELPSPIFYQDRLYLIRNGGMVTSYEATTGKLILDRQRLGILGQYVASPVAADGRIYAASESGTVVVFRAGDTLDVLARNDLGEAITATPAIADNKLYCRTSNHLWAFED